MTNRRWGCSVSCRFPVLPCTLYCPPGSYSDDGAQHAGAIDQAVLTVEGVAVGIAKRDDFFLFAIGMEAENLVNGLVAYVEEARLIPDTGPSRNPKPLATRPSFGVLIDHVPELWRLGLQLNPGARAGRPEELLLTAVSAMVSYPGDTAGLSCCDS